MAIPSITAADAYHLLRMNNAWADAGDTVGLKTAALVRADDYVRAYYSFQDDVADDNALVEEAKIILALEFLTAPVLKAETQVIERSEKLDVLEESVTYSEKAVRDPYPQVTALLKPVLKSGRGGAFTVVKLER